MPASPLPCTLHAPHPHCPAPSMPCIPTALHPPCPAPHDLWGRPHGYCFLDCCLAIHHLRQYISKSVHQYTTLRARGYTELGHWGMGVWGHGGMGARGYGGMGVWGYGGTLSQARHPPPPTQYCFRSHALSLYLQHTCPCGPLLPCALFSMPICTTSPYLYASYHRASIPPCIHTPMPPPREQVECRSSAGREQVEWGQVEWGQVECRRMALGCARDPH